MSNHTPRFPLMGLAALMGFMAAAGPAGAAEPATSFAFDFGSGAAKAGYVKVLPGAVYTKEVGYGFDLGTTPAPFASGVTSEKPFFFSVAVPEGNYSIAVTFGDAAGACVSTVKAETRRLMLEEVATAAGKFETRTFVVNVRNFRLPPPPENAPGGDQVRLNGREQGVLHWDDKLTLEFSNTRPCVDSMRIDKVDNVPTVFIAGDSTVTDQPREPTASWGQMLTRFFKPGVAVANHAESGETLKSFITGLRLDKILSQMKKGDYLFMQFGHNDQKANWPQTYVEPFTTHKQYLKVFIAEARRRGAIPVSGHPHAAAQFRRPREDPEHARRLSGVGAPDRQGRERGAHRPDRHEHQILRSAGTGEGATGVQRRPRRHASQRLRGLRTGKVHRRGHQGQPARSCQIHCGRLQDIRPGTPGPAGGVQAPRQPRKIECAAAAGAVGPE